MGSLLPVLIVSEKRAKIKRKGDVKDGSISRKYVSTGGLEGNYIQPLLSGYLQIKQ